MNDREVVIQFTLAEAEYMRQLIGWQIRHCRSLPTIKTTEEIIEEKLSRGISSSAFDRTHNPTPIETT